jgi:hypothetical protein
MYAQNKQTQYQSGVNRANIETVKAKELDTLRRGSIEEGKAIQKAEQAAGTQRAMMGATGAQVGQGSFGDILAQTATAGAQDAATIKLNAMRNAWGFGEQAKEIQAEEEMQKSKKKFGMFESALTGASRAYGIYSSAKGR